MKRAADPLDAWFGHDAAAVQTARELCDQREPVVLRSETFDPNTARLVIGGLRCPVVFGCASQRRCHCGRQRQPGACDPCGVEVGTLRERDVRFAVIELPQPALHPVQAEQIAETVGWSLEDVAAALDAEADADRYDDLLAAVDERAPALLMWTVPVVPPGDRARCLAPAEDEAWAVSEHPIELALVHLINRGNRLQRLIELNAPSIILRHDAQAQQRALNGYLAAVRAGTPQSAARPAPCAVPIERPVDGDNDEGEVVPALVWLPDGDLLVQTAGSLRRVDASTGEIRQTWPPDARAPRFVHGERMGCIERYPGFDGERLMGVGACTLDRKWLDDWPPDMPCAFVEKDQPEDGWLTLPTVKHREDAWASDRPAALAWTPDGAWIWVGEDSAAGDAVSARTTARVSLPLGAESERCLTLEGEHRHREDGDWFEGPAAFVRVARHWHILQPDGVLSIDGAAQIQLGFDWVAAGFSHDGARLAVMRPDGAVLVLATAEVGILETLRL